MTDTFKPSKPLGPSDQPDSPVIKKRKKEQCTYNQRWYDHGAQICRKGEINECDDGSWVPLGTSC